MVDSLRQREFEQQGDLFRGAVVVEVDAKISKRLPQSWILTLTLYPTKMAIPEEKLCGPIKNKDYM